MMRREKFTERAQDAAMRANEILQRYGHSQVDTEHLMLALLEQPEGVIREILSQFDVDLEIVEHRLDEELKRTPRSQICGQGVGPHITPRLKQVIDQSDQEAAKLKDDYISTEHLFLAIAGERNTPAARILASLGINRQHILDALEGLRSIRDTVEPSRRRPLPGRLAIERVAGEAPELVLSQGDQQIRILLRDVMAVIARLAGAAAELAVVQAAGRPVTEDYEGT